MSTTDTASRGRKAVAGSANSNSSMPPVPVSSAGAGAEGSMCACGNPVSGPGRRCRWCSARDIAKIRWSGSVDVDGSALAALLCGRDIRAIELRAGLSRGHVSKVMRRGRCSLATADAISMALGVRIEDFEVPS